MPFTISECFMNLCEHHGIIMGTCHTEQNTLKIASSDYMSYLTEHGYHWGLPVKSHRLPDMLLTATLEEKRAFLKIYCDLKLSINVEKNQLEIPPISVEHMETLELLLKSFEINLVIRSVGLYQTAYIQTDDLIRYRDEIGFTTPLKNVSLNDLLTYHEERERVRSCASSLPSPSPSSSSPPLPPSPQLFSHETMMVQLAHIEVEHYRGYVYDLEIEQYHNYVANGLICHNTCAAIQIAEGLKETVKRYNKKIYVMTKEGIVDNFRKELHSSERESQERGHVAGSSQCAGSNYYISPEVEPNEEKRLKLIENMIDQNYEFTGTRAFVNMVDCKIKPNLARGVSIGEYFAHSVIIIDEAHTLTEVNETGGKTSKGKKTGESHDCRTEETEGFVSAPVASTSTSKKKAVSSRKIMEVLSEIFQDEKAEGIKLILLTATPMQNTADDISRLFELLLKNDKRFHYGSSEDFKKYLFSTNGEDDIVNGQHLIKVAKGYVSYVRGENPITFPNSQDGNSSRSGKRSRVIHTTSTI